MKRPRLILVAGANGSGKSTLAKRWYSREKERFGVLLDPDAIAKEINSAKPQLAGIQAARVTLQRIQNALQSQTNLVIETTLSDSHRHIHLIEQAMAEQYRVWLWYVGLDMPEFNAARVAQRVSSGGHDVPLKDILRRRERSLHNLEVVLPLVHQAWIFDNSGRSIRIVARVNNGVLQVERGLGWWSERLEGLKINAER
jgi:predicted ABC-type ATPase